MLLAGAEAEVMPHVQAVADSILIGDGWPGRPHRIGQITAVGVQIADVDKTNDKYWSLVAHVRRAMLEAARRHLARHGGRPAGQVFDHAFTGVGAGVARQATVPAQQAAGAAPPLTVIFGKWKAESKPSSKTIHEWTTAVRRFIEVCGDLPVNTVTTAHVRDFTAAAKDRRPSCYYASLSSPDTKRHVLCTQVHNDLAACASKNGASALPGRE